MSPRVARDLARVPRDRPAIEPASGSPHRRASASGPGWFDSSWELQRGLDVREGWSADDALRGWIEGFLVAQRTCARTASPSASTAIA